ncbi:pyrimidine 5'-nucleotidase [Rhodovulum sulfidophilum]|uniref:Pyrimidine 5'-nucleotidase n=1 Tax=Rhodovulum sulfidophilum TaxID=35806 RepID=A0ABS1RRV9_RHOSU|nr:pyrimidine 5'-nucleotidase [Rhodovulum sulfidophilum]MBK5922754.1 pyrimidine 5'-nucleotidase [Rhodovulum sulfidophilum]MBL3575633.1 pyrimidine 5'-nucleotidase [Rhodovulum sulfidophilum]MBL3608786.1 pyrimidine 5'-nucleotidase [Rhodovulum sulfidophilum]MCE8420206.1 pyrimidine 5'-nucleotidase [Rhodovulum sulfidophilum]MCE8432532.1 pyrimidine 5'-nucleotidase [Rhodovulum sulfidophilum]
MMVKDLSNLGGWVFDLDNTLYPPEARLFELIEQRMTGYVMSTLGVGEDEANRLRKSYWARFGTTLTGLMELHGVEPGPYMTHVHDIALDRLSPDPELRARIAALPGRKIVHTNGSAPYAERVLAARGLDGIFDAVFGVEDAGYVPKPRRESFETIAALGGIIPGEAAIFEDDARNLAAPHEMGMRTVHVAPAPEAAPHIHHHTTDLTAFLGRL